MRQPLRYAVFALAAIVLTLLFAPTSKAQGREDSVHVLGSLGGAPYRCCYNFIVTNRHALSVAISEFRIRIISGRGRVSPGSAESPDDWTAFLASDSKGITWISSAASAEIDSGSSVSGFVFCANDTGVVRIVWETRNLDSLLTRDTVTFACRGESCDEAFFNPFPSNRICSFNIDLMNGNAGNFVINDFHLLMLTPGASFVASPSKLPNGWIRTKMKADSVSFFTTAAGIPFEKFAEGFRVSVSSSVDSFRVQYWTTNFGQLICIDTVTLACVPLAVQDTLRMVRAGGDSCCQTLTLKNTHIGQSTIGGFSIKVTTPGAWIAPPPVAPFRWTRAFMNAAGDSVFFTTAAGLAPGDSALFGSLCFNNLEATTDTIRYRWETFSEGIGVMQGLGSLVCRREVVRCDLVTATSDTTTPAIQRCITVTVRNRNSRGEAIRQFALRISNEGTQRRILSTTPPNGWQVTASGRDSVVFTGGQLLPGDSLNYRFCINMGDATSRNPLQIAWRTSGATGELCTDTLAVTAPIWLACDTVRIEETVTPVANNCCYTVQFYNRNDQGEVLDAFQLDAADPRILFTEASAAAPWNVTTTAFPNVRVGIRGSSIAPGDSTIKFSFCVDASAIPDRPTNIPLIWRTFSNGRVICIDTIVVECQGRVAIDCDTFKLASSVLNGDQCLYGFSINNKHTPGSTINRIRFRLAGGVGRFAGGNGVGRAAFWTQITVRRDTLYFAGDSVVSLDSVGVFVARVDSALGRSVRLEICSMHDDLPICCAVMDLQCGESGIELPLEPTGFHLLGAVPNPFSRSTTIRYELLRPGSVGLTIRDERGGVVRRLEAGMQSPGEQRFTIDAGDLPSGIYFYTVEANGELATGRMVLVR